MSPISGYSEILVNRNSSVSDAAKGLRSGSIVRAGQSWSPAETQNVPQPLRPESEALPELALPPEDAELAFDSDLQGQWQGNGREQADFQPSQLSFGLREKNQRFEFSQSLKQDLKQGPTPQPGEWSNKFYTAGSLSLASTAQIKDELGKEWLALEQSFSASDSGEQARSGLARYQATQALQISGDWSSAQANQSRSLGVAYQPATEGAPHPLSFSLRTTQTETAEQKKVAQNLYLQYDQSHFSYAHERSKPTQTMAGSTSPQTMQEIGMGSTFQGLSLGLNQRETIAEFFNLKTQTASLNWQLNESSQVELNHSREVLSTDDQPTSASESNQLTLRHNFDPETSSELSYLNRHQQSELFSGKWSDSQWEGGFERERNYIDPSLSQTRYQLSYASQSVYEKPLALECQVSRLEKTHGNEWNGNLRIYGTDLNESAFEAVLSVGSETPPALRVHYHQDF
ncbi:MAG: hypothetical protein AB7I41_13485 [Candidatus Sericytochromatia bacterium]